MNIPFIHGAIQGRDPFAAFMCDDASVDMLRSVTAEMDWAPEKSCRGGLRNAVQSLSITSSPKILLVDLSDSGDPLSDVHGLAEVCEPGTVVIAVGQVNDVRLYRDLLASGIHDYLLKPLSAGPLRDVLMEAQAIFAAPKPHDVAGETHVAVAVIGTRGGCGASTIATSMAWLLSTEQQLATGLLDLDIHFGTGALTLDLEPGRGLTDAIQDPARIDGLFLERAMIRVNEKLSILSAEAPINIPLMTDGAAFQQLAKELRSTFEMTVIDLPRSMMINFPLLLTDVNVIVVVTELTLAGARDTIRMLSWFTDNVPLAHLIVVANKVQTAQSEISRADFEASIEHKIDFAIPYELKSAAQAAKLGQTFAQANRNTPAGTAMRALTAHVHSVGLPKDTAITGKPAGRKSVLGKIGIKAMLMRKGRNSDRADAAGGAPG